MERIVEHIERLLQQHECVIVPDFGGFVLQKVSSVYIVEEHAFVPPGKEIVFNPTLAHNDGLLTESYMQKYGIDFDSAQLLIKGDVFEMKTLMDETACFQFSSIGSFRKEGNRLIFTPQREGESSICRSSYGLPTFHCVPVERQEEEKILPVLPYVGENKRRLRKDGVIYIPITKAFLHTLLATVAAIALFFVIAIPVKEVNKSSYTASFVPQETKKREKLPNEKKVDLPVKKEEQTSGIVFNLPDVDRKEGGRSNFGEKYQEAAPLADVNLTEKQRSDEKNLLPIEVSLKEKAPLAKEVKRPERVKEPLVKPEAPVSKAKNYYVVIGSFDTRNKANKFLKGLKGDVSSTAGILVGDGHVRVYAGVFETEQSAQSYMRKLRQKPQYKQAWLYKKR